MHRVHFHNPIIPQCLDCATTDPQEAKRQAIETLKIHFAAQQIPEKVAQHFIADIQDLNAQEMQVLLGVFEKDT